MRLVPLTEEQLWSIEFDDRHNRDARPMLREHPGIVPLVLLYGFAIEDGDRLLAIGGRVPREDGGWSWWIATSPGVLEDHLFAVTRLVRRVLRSETATGRHVAHAQDEQAGAWLETLGFEPLDEIEAEARLYAYRSSA